MPKIISTPPVKTGGTPPNPDVNKKAEVLKQVKYQSDYESMCTGHEVPPRNKKAGPLKKVSFQNGHEEMSKRHEPSPQNIDLSKKVSVLKRVKCQGDIDVMSKVRETRPRTRFKLQDFINACHVGFIKTINTIKALFSCTSPKQEDPVFEPSGLKPDDAFSRARRKEIEPHMRIQDYIDRLEPDVLARLKETSGPFVADLIKTEEKIVSGSNRFANHHDRMKAQMERAKAKQQELKGKTITFDDLNVDTFTFCSQRDLNRQMLLKGGTYTEEIRKAVVLLNQACNQITEDGIAENIAKDLVNEKWLGFKLEDWNSNNLKLKEILNNAGIDILDPLAERIATFGTKLELVKAKMDLYCTDMKADYPQEDDAIVI